MHLYYSCSRVNFNGTGKGLKQPQSLPAKARTDLAFLLSEKLTIEKSAGSVTEDWHIARGDPRRQAGDSMDSAGVVMAELQLNFLFATRSLHHQLSPVLFFLLPRNSSKHTNAL